MKLAILLFGLLALIATACMSAPLEQIAPPPAPPPASTVIYVPVIAPPPKPVPLVVQHFDAAKARELAVVLSPEVSREQIEAVAAADRRARRALTALGLQRTHVTQPVLDEARGAVRALEVALEPPGEKP
jgi:hypothetical protein